MSIFTRKSTYIGNRDATPTVPTGAHIAGGVKREATGFVTATSGDSATSYYPMVSLPSNSRVDAVRLQCDALGTSAAVDVGVYVPSVSNPALLALSSTYLAGAAISSAFFASALDVHLALAMTDITNQSGTNTVAKQEMELWQAIGLASDPGCMLDIGVAVNVAIATTGKLGIKVGYVQ